MAVRSPFIKQFMLLNLSGQAKRSPPLRRSFDSLISRGEQINLGTAQEIAASPAPLPLVDFAQGEKRIQKDFWSIMCKGGIVHTVFTR